MINVGTISKISLSCSITDKWISVINSTCPWKRPLAFSRNIGKYR